VKLRKPPNGATWFLKQFGSQSEDESVIGDLTERYQRGGGSIWYWRQVLVIVFVSHVQNIRRDKWNFLAGLFRAWCLCAGLILVQMIAVYQLVRWGNLQYIYLISTIMGLCKTLAIGAYIGRSSKIHTRTILLPFIASFVVWDIAWLVTNLLLLHRYLPPGMEFTFIIRNIMSMPLDAVLILLGGLWGTRCLTALAPKR